MLNTVKPDRDNTIIKTHESSKGGEAVSWLLNLLQHGSQHYAKLQRRYVRRTYDDQKPTRCRSHCFAGTLWRLKTPTSYACSPRATVLMARDHANVGEYEQYHSFNCKRGRMNWKFEMRVVERDQQDFWELYLMHKS